MSACFIFEKFFMFLFFSYIFCLTHSQTTHYSNANLSTTWINKPDIWDDIGILSIILSRESTVGRFVCGFYCPKYDTGGCYFGVIISPNDKSNRFTNGVVQSSLAVWSANRNNPVRVSATLNFTKDGNLILFDADGTRIWSTNTGGKSVSGLNLTDMGNLVLFDSKNRLLWQSFDHPTDSLVVGQKLRSGQRLIASVPQYYEWKYSLAVENGSLVAYIQSDPPQVYFPSDLYQDRSPPPLKSLDVKFDNGSFYNHKFPMATTAQVMKLDSDGRLRLYAWSNSMWAKVFDDILLDYLGSCGYPDACGSYGVCSIGKCSCPETSDGDTSFFRQIESIQPDFGCAVTTPIHCEYPNTHFLLHLESVTYFDSSSNLYSEDIELERCKDACLTNCSCIAAMFVYRNDRKSNRGSCALRNEVFSFATKDGMYRDSPVSVFVKVSDRKSRHVKVILGYTMSALLGFLAILGASFIIFVKYIKFKKIEELYLDQVPGMPSRFSYEDLKAMTNNFTSKLGEGGFASVFEGTLKNGDKIAVKRLDVLGLAKKSFLAEVETIGSIHHVNLVKLIGFCAEKSYRLLVYEYMCNGSLDKWIFCKNKDNALGWSSRKTVILHVAKGLAYLHEDCRQKIVHLDIKPQNILLDGNFDAKVADFGLSKLIDKDQSQVVTTLRGTLGYMAPEWLSSVITEKVDVYSFGVMVLEILCGRKNLDRTQLEEDAHLLGVFKAKAENDELLDLVDQNSEDMLLNGSEVVEMMKVAAWCLQSDFRRRPSMSDVIMVLQGTMEVESNSDYDFLIPPVPRLVADRFEDVITTTPLPSALSGPR